MITATPRPARVPCVWNWSTTVVAVLVLALCLTLPWFRLNIEPSVPYGLYRLSALPTVLERGMLVTLPVPLVMWPWHSALHDFLKPVAAVEGDWVCVGAEVLRGLPHLLIRFAAAGEIRLSINGVDYGPVYHEADGQPLPRLPQGCRTIAEGEVFLASQEARSIDSRYFGPVHIADLAAQAFPVLTWR